MNLISLLALAGFDPAHLVSGAIGGTSLDKWTASYEPKPGDPSQKIPAPTNIHVQEQGTDLHFEGTFIAPDGTTHTLTATGKPHSSSVVVTDNGVVVPGGTFVLHLHVMIFQGRATVEFDIQLGASGPRFRADGQVEYHKPAA